MQDRLKAIFSMYKGEPGELIPVLQHVQEEIGYLPEEALVEIARFVGASDSLVYSVATFYAQFRFTPTGKNRVMVCRGTACHVRGGEEILAELENQLGIKEGETTPDLQFSLETVACIGACGLAPTMMINKSTYGHLTPEKISGILDSVRSRGEGRAAE